MFVIGATHHCQYSLSINYTLCFNLSFVGEDYLTKAKIDRIICTRTSRRFKEFVLLGSLIHSNLYTFIIIVEQRSSEQVSSPPLPKRPRKSKQGRIIIY